MYLLSILFRDSDTPSLPDGKKTMIAVAKKVSVLEGEDKKPTAYLTTEGTVSSPSPDDFFQ